MVLDLIQHIRCNHALEHATIALLASRSDTAGIPVGGNSTARGFYLFGDVTMQAIQECATEALQRLRQGEHQLAISPFCGTNFVVSATLGAAAAALVLGQREHLRRFPNAALAVLGTLIASQSIGRFVQAKFTTSPNVGGLTIRDVTKRGWLGRTIHRVHTAFE
jgi:hypothetical protein